MDWVKFENILTLACEASIPDLYALPYIMLGYQKVKINYYMKSGGITA